LSATSEGDTGTAGGDPLDVGFASCLAERSAVTDLKEVVNQKDREIQNLHQQIFAMSNTMEALKVRLLNKELELVDLTAQGIATQRSMMDETVPDTLEGVDGGEA